MISLFSFYKSCYNIEEGDFFMKKITFFIICLITLFGCATHKEESHPHFEMYSNIKEQLKNAEDFDVTVPFDINLQFVEADNGYHYHLIIDNVSEDMYNIVAMAYADENDEQMCPTLGIFDEEPFHLVPGVVDKVNCFYKGVQLSGTVLQKQDIRLWIRYYQDESKTKAIEKIIEVKMQ